MSKHTHQYLAAIDNLASRIIEELPEEGHAHTRKLHAEVMRLRAGSDALGNLHATPNPTETEGAHQKRVASAAAKFSADVVKTNERMHSIIRDGLNEIDRRLESKVKLKPDDYAAEIRAAFRGMSSTDQFKLLGELVEANRGVELAAIVKAPAILTGISAEVQSRFTAAIISKHAPAEYAEKNTLMEAFMTATLANSKVAGEAAQAFSDPAKLASIEAGERAAAAAAAAFDGALTTT